MKRYSVIIGSSKENELKEWEYAESCESLRDNFNKIISKIKENNIIVENEYCEFTTTQNEFFEYDYFFDYNIEILLDEDCNRSQISKLILSIFSEYDKNIDSFYLLPRK